MLARPAPLAACGMQSTPIRNAIDCVVMDVEQYGLVGEVSNSAMSALAESMDSELIIHPVGQFVAIRKVPVPNELLSKHVAESVAQWESQVLAKPWPPAFMFLNGTGEGRVHCGVTAVAVAPNKKVVAVCERLRPRGCGDDGSSELESRNHESVKAGKGGEEGTQDGPDATVPAVPMAPAYAVERAVEATVAVATMGAGDFDARVSIYHITSGQLMKELVCPTNGAEWTSVAFSPDSAQLVTTSN